MASRMEWVAARQAPNGEPTALASPVKAQAFRGVTRTGGLETTDWAHQLREGQLVDPDQKNESLGQHQGGSASVRPRVRKR
jgi:hypothetical protein